MTESSDTVWILALPLSTPLWKTLNYELPRKHYQTCSIPEGWFHLHLERWLLVFRCERSNFPDGTVIKPASYPFRWQKRMKPVNHVGYLSRPIGKQFLEIVLIFLEFCEKSLCNIFGRQFGTSEKGKSPFCETVLKGKSPHNHSPMSKLLDG